MKWTNVPEVQYCTHWPAVACGLSKQQAASEILHLQYTHLELAMSYGRVNLCHRRLKIRLQYFREYLIGVSLFCISLFSSVLIPFFFFFLYKLLCLKGLVKEIIKRYTEENCLNRRGRNPRWFREVPQTLFWIIINFFLTIILWCCLCLITRVFLTRVTGIIWKAIVMIKLRKCQLLPTCSSKHRAGSVRRWCSLLIRSELLFHVDENNPDCYYLNTNDAKRC